MDDHDVEPPVLTVEPEIHVLSHTAPAAQGLKRREFRGHVIFTYFDQHDIFFDQ